jgi:hypothetical protein
MEEEVWTSVMANRGRAKANFLESLAELDKTFDMIIHPLMNLSNYIRTFRPRKKGKVRRRPRRDGRDTLVFSSSEWLRFRYGISPLISDVRAAMATLKESYNSAVPKTIRSTARLSAEQQSSLDSYVLFDVVRIDYRQTDRHRFDVKALWIDKVVPSPWRDLGFTLPNLVGLPWELTRLSFVVDWIANIGDLIYANVPRVDLRPLGGGLTGVEYKRRSLLVTKTASASASYTTEGTVGGDFSKEKTYKYRTAREDFGSLVLRDDFRLLTWKRAADSIALISQQLGRIKFGR